MWSEKKAVSVSVAEPLKYLRAHTISLRSPRVAIECACGLADQAENFPNMIYWLTGQPGAGKTTLATALKSALRRQGYPVVHLDGEFLRELMGNKDFSQAGRTKNIRAAQKLAAKLHADGIIVVASFVSPYRSIREEFKTKSDVVEIYVHTNEIRGKENYFVADFEPPQYDFVDIDTTKVSVEACVERILQRAPSSEPA